jgi:DNA-binding protein Fis
MKEANDTIARSPAVAQILRGLELTRDLYVASILIGERYSGKRTLLKRLFPELPRVSGEDERALSAALEMENALIITEFEAVKYPRELDFQNKRILAVADGPVDPGILDEKFAFIYRMPPLRERPEEIESFTRHFLHQAKEELMIDGEIVLDPARLDLSQNLRSLKASIYREALLQSLDASEIEQALERLFAQSLEGNNAYRENLGLLERPLLKAGLARYGSQLKLAGVLGINRNTLRKKLHEYRID